jgi:hypothetical protein
MTNIETYCEIVLRHDYHTFNKLYAVKFIIKHSKKKTIEGHIISLFSLNRHLCVHVYIEKILKRLLQVDRKKKI